MARLTKQQLRTMELRDRRNMRQAERGVLALALILIGATWWLCVALAKVMWWLYVILPIRFARWLTRAYGWRGWLVFGGVVVVMAVLGTFVGGH